jgi:hypothetical protein
MQEEEGEVSNSIRAVTVGSNCDHTVYLP